MYGCHVWKHGIWSSLIAKLDYTACDEKFRRMPKKKGMYDINAALVVDSNIEKETVSILSVV